MSGHRGSSGCASYQLQRSQREVPVRDVLRWWETLDRPERIVALSIGLAAPVAIINSTVWAIAICYMTRQKAQVEIERLRARASEGATEARIAPAARPASHDH